MPVTPPKLRMILEERAAPAKVEPKAFRGIGMQQIVPPAVAERRRHIQPGQVPQYVLQRRDVHVDDHYAEQLAGLVKDGCRSAQRRCSRLADPAGLLIQADLREEEPPRWQLGGFEEVIPVTLPLQGFRRRF